MVDNWRRVHGKVQLPRVTVTFPVPGSNRGIALPHASFGGWSSPLPTSFRDAALPLGILVWTLLDSLQLDLVATPSRDRSALPRPIFNRTTRLQQTSGMSSAPACPLVANPWTDHTSIRRFFSHQVERWMLTIFGMPLTIFPRFAA